MHRKAAIHNGCCLAYIGKTSDLDSNHYGGHCIEKCAHFQQNQTHCYMSYLQCLRSDGFSLRPVFFGIQIMLAYQSGSESISNVEQNPESLSRFLPLSGVEYSSIWSSSAGCNPRVCLSLNLYTPPKIFSSSIKRTEDSYSI